MALRDFGGVMLEVDEDGFIQDPSEWNETVAGILANDEGVSEMTEDHWKVVKMIRDYYLQHGIAPMVRKVCKDTGRDLNQIYALFPSGPAKGAYKVAGLPTGHAPGE